MGGLSVRDLSLRTRVLGTFVLLFVLTAGGFAGAWHLLHSQYRQDAAVINEAGRQRLRIQKMVTLAHRIGRGAEEKREELRAVAAQFERTLGAFQKGDPNRALPAAPPSVQPQVRAVRAAWEEFRSSVEVIAQRDPTSTAFQEGLADLQRRSEVLLAEADRTVQVYQAAHEEEMQEMRWLLGSAAPVLLGLVGLVLFFAERHVARPLARLRREATAIAEGDLGGNVTVVDTQDEIGALTRSIRKMKDRLADSLKEVKIFRAVVEHAGHSIYWTGRDGIIEHVNPAFEEITGYSQEEAVGQTPRILQSGAHDEAFYEDLWSTIKGGDVWQGEIVDQRSGGEKYVVDQTIAPIQNGEGQVEHFVAVGHEVTEKKKYEKVLQKERDRFAALFENLPTPVVRCEVRENGTIITAANPAFEDTFGIERSAAGGQDINEVLVPEEQQKEAFEIDRLALKKGTLETEVKRQTAGEPRDFQLQVAEWESEEGPPEVYAIYTDITEQKEREAQLKRQNEQLDRFASVLTHDLRNPLNVAKGRLVLSLEKIEEIVGSESSVDLGLLPDHLQSANQALGRMERLVADMLALTWSEQSFGGEEMGEVSLRLVAEDCWQQVEVGEAVLQVERDLNFLAHEGRLQQFLENLFRNAIEHGGEAVRITVGSLLESKFPAEESPDGFYVEDNGPGISEKEREKVFERGYSSEEGTGLGLSIAEAIAEAHDWAISVAEGSGGGARFEIRGVETTPPSEEAETIGTENESGESLSRD